MAGVSCSGCRESLRLEVWRRDDNFLQVSYKGSPLREPVAQTRSDYRQTPSRMFAVGGVDVRSTGAVSQTAPVASREGVLSYNKAEE